MHITSAHQALADVQALKECLFATEIKAHMKAIPNRSAKEEEKHWKARVKIRVEMKKLVFNFGKSVSQSLARKMAREGVTYSKIEELYLKAQSLETFSKSMDGILKTTKTTKEKLFWHFLQFSKRQTSG